MKRLFILAGCCLDVLCAAQAQQPHNVAGYAPKTNTMTVLHYGYGNTLESITVAGESQTTIKVASNGQPKSISNERATVEFTFAGTSNVTVSQTVQGVTTSKKVPVSSDYVLQFRKKYAEAKAALAGAIDKADKFLENGGASLVGGLIGTIGDAVSDPGAAINICFQQALDAAQKTDNPIIPIDCLKGLVEATKAHDSVKDRVKGEAVDYIFSNYKEWRDGWADFVYKGAVEFDNLLQANNKKKHEERVAKVKEMIDSGMTPEEAAQAVEEEEFPKLDTEDNVLNYISSHGHKRPDAIHVNIYKYFLNMPYYYELVWDKDKKTYLKKNVCEPLIIDYDRELDEPYCDLTLWYWSSKDMPPHIKIPLKKGHVPGVWKSK